MFDFKLQAVFVLEISTCLSWLFGYIEKRLDKKAKVNLEIYEVAKKFMRSQTGQQIMAIHIFHNISRTSQSGNEKLR